ncbi:glycosyltransferase [Mycolicibacterium vaccae]|uniref:glycosyltransferase n=1 Tax=Mycolicibacterium vaccae TaxID=1810 RepID=UPI003D08EB8B
MTAEVAGPLFSIVIPTYNRAGTIRRTLESVQAQTFGDFECLVVDDGSADGEALESVVASMRDDRFRYVRQPNKGAGSARNRGFDIARGRYVALLDSDDHFLPHKLEVCAEMIGRERGEVLLYSQVLVERGIDKVWVRPPRGVAAGERVDEYLMCTSGSIQTSTMVLNTDLARKVRFDESLPSSQDTDFAIRVANAGARITYLERPLVVFEDSTHHGRVSKGVDHESQLAWIDGMRGVHISDRAYWAYRGWQCARLASYSDRLYGFRLYMNSAIRGVYPWRHALIIAAQVLMPRSAYQGIANKVVAIFGRGRGGLAPMSSQSDGGGKPMHADTTRVYVNMHAQVENAGDALVLRELIDLVSSRADTEVFLGAAPDGFVRQLHLEGKPNVRAHQGRRSLGMVRGIVAARLRGHRCFYFLTAGAPNGERTRAQFMTDLLRLAWLSALVVIGVRVCQVGVSFERIGPRHARILRWRSRLLHASVPRDRLTLEYSEQLGVRTTAMAPDVAINLFRTPPVSHGEGRRRIAFSFRVDKDPGLCESYKSVVASLTQRGEPEDEFVFVSQVARDTQFMRELKEMVETDAPGRTQFLDLHQDIDAAFALYETCRVVASNRLHALLSGLKSGATPLALTAPELDPKITGVFESIGLSHQVFDVRVASTGDLVAAMKPMSFDGSAVAGELDKFYDSLIGPRRREAVDVA